MKIQASIFDWDGPINDSFREGLRRIETLARMEGIVFDKAHRRKLTGLWGVPGTQLLEQGLDISREQAEAMYPKWEVWDLVQPTPLVPGAREALRWNRQHGIINTLLTSRNRQNILDIFEKLDLMREFEIISTRQDVQFSKPDPRAFDFTLKGLAARGIDKESCIFIGDNRVDILCGQAAEVETLVVMTGQYWMDDILTYPVKPQNIIPSVDYLPEWIEKHADE